MCRAYFFLIFTAKAGWASGGDPPGARVCSSAVSSPSLQHRVIEGWLPWCFLFSGLRPGKLWFSASTVCSPVCGPMSAPWPHFCEGAEKNCSFPARSAFLVSQGQGHDVCAPGTWAWKWGVTGSDRSAPLFLLLAEASVHPPPPPRAQFPKSTSASSSGESSEGP